VGDRERKEEISINVPAQTFEASDLRGIETGSKTRGCPPDGRGRRWLAPPPRSTARSQRGAAASTGDPRIFAAASSSKMFKEVRRWIP